MKALDREVFTKAVGAAFDVWAESRSLNRCAPPPGGGERVTVIYCNPRTILEITFDRGELDAGLGLVGLRDASGALRSFPLRLVMGAVGLTARRERWPRIVSRETLIPTLKELRDELDELAEALLRGESVAFQRLVSFTALDAQLRMSQFGPDRRPSDVWKPVQAAWDGADLTELVRLIDALPGPVREIEEELRAYALRYGSTGVVAGGAPPGGARPPTERST